MKFPSCKIKGIKSDLVAETISLTFVCDLNTENTEAAYVLSNYADKDAGHVEVSITPQQLPLFDDEIRKDVKKLKDMGAELSVEGD
jgi:hypothetical protein